MNREGIVLFIHILGVIAVFGGLVLFQNSGRHLRRAATWPEARSWLALLRQAPAMFIGGSILLLGSGLELAREQWGFTTPWVVVGIATVTSFAALAVLTVRPCLARLTRLADGREGTIPAEMRVVFRAPSLWSPIFAMNGAALGVLWLMTNKPGWAMSIGVPAALALLGYSIAHAIRRHGSAKGSEAPTMGGSLAHRARR
jgi:hypothetical protein